MLTIDTLKQFGADSDDGLARCLNNEAFYFKPIGKAADDKNFDSLEKAIEDNDLDSAFETGHSLKGVLGNLALTPIYTPVYEMTELLRSRRAVDYSPYLEEVKKRRAELKEILS
ncbi:MAG: Hpt domain-containing protein [Saccharofermentans sp.]|nr:Hpt domain-containing protein [Saccharofermentans sp.]